MHNYLVTGGAGFIGSCFAKKLIAEGHKVYILDNLSTGYRENVPAGAEFVLGDTFGDKVKEFEGIKFKAIYHIAGQSSGEISFTDPVYDIRTNGESTLNLLQFARRNSCDKFIYASTMSVYGSVPDAPIDESHQTKPLSFYGVGKLASEHYLRIYEKEYGISSSVLRLFNVYGPGQNLKNMRQGMISIFMAYVLDGKPIHIKGSGERYRDFVYIDDVVEAFWKVRDAQGFGIYNVGSGQKTLLVDLVQKILIAMKKDPKTYSYFFEGSTPGDQFGIYSNSQLFRQKYAWTPCVDLDEGLKRMADWAKNLEGHA